jgi:hypothetical protein
VLLNPAMTHGTLMLGSHVRVTGLFAGIFLLVMGLASCGDPARANYEMQELCGRDARDWFNEFWGPKTENRLTSDNYQNHYNAKLNRFFVRIIAVDVSAGRVHQELFDVNENRSIGSATENGGDPINCKVNNQKCTTIKDWEDTVNSMYLER